ncbi:hypothetical protein [Nocardiopsis sp. CNR-923]|uniref:hypothetical protein n=1 Tax=Nocardiopsis sp. CNR-923 TaxID=1904965 RepID=UPI00117CE15F|nr:hypothetical protein [Nocardiopsis sp. CNR-923]
MDEQITKLIAPHTGTIGLSEAVTDGYGGATTAVIESDQGRVSSRPPRTPRAGTWRRPGARPRSIRS